LTHLRAPTARERRNDAHLRRHLSALEFKIINPGVRRRKGELAELANEPWVLPPQESLIGSVFTKFFRACGLDYPRAAVIAFPHDVRTAILATGRFLTIFHASTLKFPRKLPELKALPITLPNPDVQMGIVTLNNRTLSPVAQLFIEHARELAKPPAKRKQ
jgi:DNA-binding transcriptional LysR family regulator